MDRPPARLPLTPEELDQLLGPRGADALPADFRIGWECKPCGRIRHRWAVGICVTIVCLLPVAFAIFFATEKAEMVCAVFTVVIPAVSSAFISLSQVLRRGFDFLYLDARGFVHLRQMNDGAIKRLTVRFENVERIEFRGSLFLRTFRAIIIGNGFETRRGYEDRKIKTRRRRKARLNAEVLRLHPRLLERLIQLAERQEDMSLYSERLESAKLHLRDWTPSTSEAIPLEPWDEEALGAGEELA